MIEINDVTKKYGSFTAIENINCSVKEGSIFGLIGYNGAGKTTLLKTICGILKPECGQVTLNNKEIFENPLAKSQIFLVPDDPYYLPYLSMKSMAKFYKGYYSGWNDNIFKKLIEIFKLDPNKRFGSFSKGMQRQAFIIFALSTSPKYLLMDEAFDGIDPMMRDLVRQLLLEMIAERGTGVMISSHNLRELDDLCDKISVINGKTFVYNANIEDIRSSMQKYRLVTAEDFDESVFTEMGINYKNLKRNGNIVSFVVDGSADETTEKLKSLKPLLLESTMLTLEEIFLIEMEAKIYDFKDIFK